MSLLWHGLSWDLIMRQGLCFDLILCWSSSWLFVLRVCCWVVPSLLNPIFPPPQLASIVLLEHYSKVTTNWLVI